MNKKLVLTLFANFAAFAVNMAMNFFLAPYIISNIGADAYGFVSLAENFTSYAQVITIALNTMAARYITIYYAKKEFDKANRYFTSVLYANIILSLVFLVPAIILIIYLEYVINIPTDLIRDVKLLFSVTFLSFFVTLVGTAYATSTFAANRKDLEAKRYIESHVVKVAAVLLMFIVFSPKVTYVGIASLFAAIYIFITNYQYTKKLTPELEARRKHFNFLSLVEVIKSGVWNSLSRLGNLLSTGLDLLVTNLLINPLAMGVLSISKVIPNALGGIIGTIDRVFAPACTIAYANNDKEQLLREIRKSILVLSCLTNLCIAGLTLLGAPFYRLWTPDVDSRTLLFLSVLGMMYCVVEGPIQCIWNLFVIVNKLKVNCIVNLLSGFVSIFVLYVLLKTTDYGVFAVATVNSVIATLRTLLFTVPYAAKCVGIKKRVFYIPVLKSVVALAVSLLFGFALCSIFTPTGWISIFVIAIPISIFTLIVTALFMAKKGEIKLALLTLSSKFVKNK